METFQEAETINTGQPIARVDELEVRNQLEEMIRRTAGMGRCPSIKM